MITDLLGIRIPLIQAPMAGSDSVELALAVADAGGLGSLGCAMLAPEQIRSEVAKFSAISKAPLNLNFFCHRMPAPDAAVEAKWRKALEPFYKELGLDINAIPPAPIRKPFDEDACRIVEELKPKVVSFHFGLPDAALFDRVRKTGAKVLASATSVDEALWLEAKGVDVIIAQGSEAGGHRGTFLNLDTATQVGTFALVPQIVDAVKVPVVAAGGIADGRGVAAALILGAQAVQIGTAYLFCPEAKVSAIHRAALKSAGADQTVLTNVFSGRPARGILNRIVRSLGIMSPDAPIFPIASTAIAPLRTKSEAIGSPDFMQLWSGQSAALCEEMSAKDLTLKLISDANEIAHSLQARGRLF